MKIPEFDPKRFEEWFEKMAAKEKAEFGEPSEQFKKVADDLLLRGKLPEMVFREESANEVPKAEPKRAKRA